MSFKPQWPNGNQAANQPRINSPWGARTPFWTPEGMTGSFHSGVDLSGWTHILAPENGIVRSGWHGGYGNQVMLEADSGFRYRLAHNASYLVPNGARVVKGQRVAVMGTTGRSTGVHCHLEVIPPGANTEQAPTWGTIDPVQFFKGIGEMKMQKITGADGANRRKGKPTTNAPRGEGLKPFEVGNFTGWVIGQSVEGNPVWFVGISGDYFWSGGFIGLANVTGLKYLGVKA